MRCKGRGDHRAQFENPLAGEWLVLISHDELHRDNALSIKGKYADRARALPDWAVPGQGSWLPSMARVEGIWSMNLEGQV